MGKLTLIFLLTFTSSWAFGAEEPIRESLIIADSSGDADSQYELGTALDNGELFGPEIREAFRWYKLAADQGHTEAEYKVGVMYLEGRGSPQNFDRGDEYLGRAASKGNPNAQLTLGEIRLLDNSAPQAYALFSLATAMSDSTEAFEAAIEGRDRAAANLDETELGLLQTIISACIDSEFAECAIAQLTDDNEVIEVSSSTPDLGLLARLSELANQSISADPSLPEASSADTETNAVEPRDVAATDEVTTPSSEFFTLEDLVNSTLIGVGESYTADPVFVDESFFSAQLVSHNSEPHSALLQISLMIDSEGRPHYPIVNFAAGEYPQGQIEKILDSLMAGSYPPAFESKLKKFLYFIKINGNTHYGRIENRGTSRRLSRASDRIVGALEGHDVEKATEYYEEFLDFSAVSLDQYTSINQTKLLYQLSIPYPTATLLDTMDAILSTNGSEVFLTLGQLDFLEDQRIDRVPGFLKRFATSNRVDETVTVGAFYTPMYQVIQIRRQYWKTLVDARRFIESISVWEKMAEYDDAEFLLEISDVAASVELALANHTPRVVEDIVDGDSLAGLYFDQDTLVLTAVSGDFSKAQIYCDQNYIEYKFSDVLEITPGESWGECALYISGTPGSVYKAAFN